MVADRFPARPVTCARCGAAFACGTGGRAGGCWCTDEAYRMPMPASAAEDCLCQTCLRKQAEATGRHAPAKNGG